MPERVAFWGAAAFLNGVVRYYMALTAVFVDASDSLTNGFPFVVLLFVSKWVGDLFTSVSL